MRAAYKEGGRFSVREIGSRALKTGEIRLRIDACGVCGSDVHANPEQMAAARFGHEAAGTVVEIGPGVEGLDPGMPVALDSSSPCGKCGPCKDGRQELCADIRSMFSIGEYGLADEMIAPAVSALPASGMDPAVACLQEPLGVAIDMVRLADVTIESNVLVIGQGPIGLMALSLVRRAGARRIFSSGFARRTARFALAGAVADECIDAADADIASYDFRCPIDRILVTAPPSALPGSFQAACKGGIISFIGIEHGAGAFCTFDVNAFHFKKLQLRASFASPALFGPMALRFLADGTVDGASLVSHRFGLSEIAKAMTAAASAPDAVKVVVEPRRG